MSEITDVSESTESGTEKKSVCTVLEEKKTPWRSIWICNFMRVIVGLQLSIYYLSMWPYLHGLDKTATIDFLGWVISACSLTCAIANPIFGYWNQKTMSVKNPTIFGFVLSAIGQLIYGLLPIFSSNHKWIMLVARLITGFGTGNLSVLRAYAATAPLLEDKLSSISHGTAAYVLGASFGPALQSFFTPVGTGWVIGGILFDMYTLPAFVMVIITLGSCPVMWFYLKEEYAGIVSEEDQKASNIVVPKYDLSAALVCVWCFASNCFIFTNIDVMVTPMTTVMYGWKDSTAVRNNGLIQSVECILSVISNILIGYTRIGKIDKRKQIFFGLTLFAIYHIACFPWSFYPGPLKYIPNGTTTAEVGGCDPTFTWCEHTTAVPMPIYIACFIIVFGIAFPFVGSPSSSLFSEILGPRPQGLAQGLYSFVGSFVMFAAPIISTNLFKHTGYIWVVTVQSAFVAIAVFLMILFYRRLKALQLLPVDMKIIQTVDKDL